MPSQSPTNGSRNHNTNTNAAVAGIDHHGQAFQNATGESAGRTTGAVGWRLSKLSDVAGGFVVGCAWFNELTLNRRSLHHLYAITLLIVLNFVHDIVHKQDATT